MLVLQILIAALLITRLTVSLGARAGLVDGPSERKQHHGVIPLTGGIAIFLTLLFGTFVLGIAPYTYSMLALIFIFAERVCRSRLLVAARGQCGKDILQCGHCDHLRDEFSVKTLFQGIAILAADNPA